MPSKSNQDNVIQLRPSKANKVSEKKWSKPVLDLGFCILPSLMFRAQRRLGLNATQLTLLIHLADYWWHEDRKPYPAVKTLGERMNLGERQIRRLLAELEKAGFLKRIERRAAHRGKLTNEYDLSGLVKKLRALEPEFRKVEEEIKQSRKAVTRRGARVRAS